MATKKITKKMNKINELISHYESITRILNQSPELCDKNKNLMMSYNDELFDMKSATMHLLCCLEMKKSDLREKKIKKAQTKKQKQRQRQKQKANISIC